MKTEEIEALENEIRNKPNLWNHVGDACEFSVYMQIFGNGFRFQLLDFADRLVEESVFTQSFLDCYNSAFNQAEEMSIRC